VVRSRGTGDSGGYTGWVTSDRGDVSAALHLDRERTLAQIEALARAFEDIVESAELVATDDEHDPEGHTIAYERQMTAALLDRARARLAELEDAIARLEAGTYGTCEQCGGRIGPERLEARPATTTCIDCAS
jgi:DnaK suppressor protein